MKQPLRDALAYRAKNLFWLVSRRGISHSEAGIIEPLPSGWLAFVHFGGDYYKIQLRSSGSVVGIEKMEGVIP